MTEEIKEILDKFSNRKQGTLLQAIRELKEQDVKHACVTTEENINKLLNYITNLQKENVELKDTIKKDNHLLGCNFSKKDKYKQERDIYKQRNEKAVEKLKRFDIEYLHETYQHDLANEIEFLLNILEGGDE